MVCVDGLQPMKKSGGGLSRKRKDEWGERCVGMIVLVFIVAMLSLITLSPPECDIDKWLPNSHECECPYGWEREEETGDSRTKGRTSARVEGFRCLPVQWFDGGECACPDGWPPQAHDTEDKFFCEQDPDWVLQAAPVTNPSAPECEPSWYDDVAGSRWPPSAGCECPEGTVHTPHPSADDPGSSLATTWHCMPPFPTCILPEPAGTTPAGGTG